MTGIPSTLLARLRTVLLRCGPFATDHQLRATFVDSRISAWQDYIPEASSRSERVDLTIECLRERHNSTRENALILFVQVLSEWTVHDDSCQRDLLDLVPLLEQVVEKHSGSVSVDSQNSFVITARRPTDYLSHTAAKNRIKRWFRLNIWTNRELLSQLQRPSNLQLGRWPLFLYTGECRVAYTIQRHENHGQIDGKIHDRRDTEKWHPVSQYSKPLKFAVLEPAPPELVPVAERRLMIQVVRALNADTPRTTSDWQPLNIFFSLNNALMKRILLLPSFLAGFSGDVTEYLPPLWPNLAPAKGSVDLRVFEDKSYPANDNDLLAIWEREIAERLRQKVSSQIHDVVMKTDGAGFEEIINRIDELHPLLFPVWIFRARANDKPVTVVLNALNGKIAYANVPTNLTAKVIVIAVSVLLLLIIVIALVNLS